MTDSHRQDSRSFNELIKFLSNRCRDLLSISSDFQTPSPTSTSSLPSLSPPTPTSTSKPSSLTLSLLTRFVTLTKTQTYFDPDNTGPIAKLTARPVKKRLKRSFGFEMLFNNFFESFCWNLWFISHMRQITQYPTLTCLMHKLNRFVILLANFNIYLMRKKFARALPFLQGFASIQVTTLPLLVARTPRGLQSCH